MSTYVSVQGRGTIALPSHVRSTYHLNEPGAQVEVIEEEGRIILLPKLPVDAGQAWYWQADWQAGERQADTEHAAGLGKVYETADDFIEDLGN